MLYKFVKLKYTRKKTSEFVENVIKKKKDCGAKKTVLATFNCTVYSLQWMICDVFINCNIYSFPLEG